MSNTANVEFTTHGPFQMPPQFLQFPNHYVNMAYTFKTDDPAAKTIDGRKIIPAGTIYPANDATAIGVVFYDIDLTNGARTGAIMIHGFAKVHWMPAAPTAEAIAALPMIKFFPNVV